MASIQNFTDLKVWQKARVLSKLIYEMTLLDKFSKDYGLKNQINDSSGSIMDNIAEGFGRKGNLELINFLTYAYGSTLECMSQVNRAFDRLYISEINQTELLSLLVEISKMLTSLIIYLRGSDIRGEKFKTRRSPPKTNN